MTREDRINALISLDEKINTELLGLQENVKELSVSSKGQESYNQLMSRVSFIQQLFDRVSEVIRDLSLSDADARFLEAAQAKDRISNNYVRFNRLKKEIDRAFNKDRQTETDLSERSFHPAQQPEEEQEEEVSAEIPEEEPEADVYIDEEALLAEEETERKAAKKKKNKHNSDDFAEQQRRMEAERYNQELQRQAELENERRRSLENEANRQQFARNNDYPTPAPIEYTQPSYQSPSESGYPSDYPTDKPQKQVSAADMRDEQYRYEEQKAADREEARARRQETHDKFVAYQNEHRPSDVPQSEPSAQGYATQYHVPEQRSASHTEPSRPLEPQGPAYPSNDYPKSGSGQYNSPDYSSRPASPSGIYSYTPTGTAFVDSSHLQADTSYSPMGYQGFSYEKENLHRSENQSPDYPTERPQKQFSAADLRDEQYKYEEKRATDREEARARRQETHDKFVAYQNEQRPSAIPVTENSRSQNSAPRYNAPESGSYNQGRPVRPANPAYAPRVESQYVQSAPMHQPQHKSGSDYYQNPVSGASHSTSGSSHKPTPSRTEVTQYGYTPTGVFANTAVNGVLRPNHTTYRTTSASLTSTGSNNNRVNYTQTKSESVHNKVPHPSTTGTHSTQKGPARTEQGPVPVSRPVPRYSDTHQNYRQNRRSTDPIGSTGQSKRENLNRPKKSTVEEPGSGLTKKDRHLRYQKIASTYAKAIGGKAVRYTGGVLSMGARKLYSVMQEGDDNALRGFESSRYYGMATARTIKAMMPHKKYVNSRTLTKKYIKSEQKRFKSLSKLRHNEIDLRFNQNKEKCINLKNEINALNKKGAKLTPQERAELLGKRKELKSLSRDSRKLKGLERSRQRHAAEYDISKAFEERARGKRVTKRVIRKELQSQRSQAEAAMKKTYGDLSNMSNRKLSREIKKLTNQIKSLEAKGASLSALDRKTLSQLKDRLKSLTGLQDARTVLKDKLKFGEKLLKKLEKRSFARKNGLFALQRLMLTPLFKSDEAGVQGLAKAVNISTNPYVRKFTKSSLKMTWGAAKYGGRVVKKVASGVYNSAKAAAAKRAATKGASDLLKTARTAGKASGRLKPKKVKTGKGSNLLKKKIAKPAASMAKQGAKGVTKKAAKAGTKGLGALLKGGSLKIIAIVLAVVLLLAMVSGFVTIIIGAGGSTVLSPDVSADKKIDLEPYYEIILDEWYEYIEELDDIADEIERNTYIVNTIIDIEPYPENIREILSMMAVRMSQDLDLDKNDDIEPYIRYLVRKLNPYTTSEEGYTATIAVDPLFFDSEDNFDDPIFSADEMANEDQEGVAGGLIGYFELTHYAPTGRQTASQTDPEAGRTIAVDKNVIPLGTHVIINGHEYIAEDTGDAIIGNIIDIFVDSNAEAIEKGRIPNVPVYKVTYEGEGIQTAGEWEGWNADNQQWAKTIYYQDWSDLYTGVPFLGVAGDNSTDLSGVTFVDGDRPGNTEIANIGKAEDGVSGRPNKFTRWYGKIGNSYSYHWCAAFVSWCANEAGVLDTAIPKFASCSMQGVPWFKSKGQWARPGDITPVAGDVIFFDWQPDGRPDHVGLVIGSDRTKVYVVHGNYGTPERVRIDSFNLNYECIYGYGIPNY